MQPELETGIVEPVQGVTILLSVSAGVLSFLSPCVLPLVPSYLAFLSGMSGPAVAPAASPKTTPGRAATLLHAGLFIAGFSLVFIALGASFSLLGQLVFQSRSLLQKLGGALIIAFGLTLAGVLRLPFLQREWRVHLRARPAGYAGSLLVGIAFASGWVPCVGPVLGSILLFTGVMTSLNAYFIRLTPQWLWERL
jgi:cytochrome c-type biogenesis protein